MKKTRFVALDSWRGVCALLVAVHNLDFGPWLPQDSFVAHSSLFVDFFFVLSGFVISHAYMDNLSHVSDVVSFILRRIGRLWPLHVTVLAALISLHFLKFAAADLLHLHFDDSAVQGGHSMRAIATNLLLIQAFDIPSRLTWNSPSWSISTELWTYVLFAVICLVKPFRGSSTFMGAIALLAAGVVFLFSPNFLETNTDYAFFRCLYGFFIGHLVYKAWQVNRLRSGGMLEVLILALVVGFVTVVGTGMVSMVAPLLFGFAVLVFAEEKGWISDVLMMRPFVQLGAWSYSIYMVHWLIRNILVGVNEIDEKMIERQAIPSFMSLNHTWVTCVVLVGYIVAVVGLASVTHRLIEQPGRGFFNRVSGKF